MGEKTLILTLTSDLFVDKHQLKIYQYNDTYLLSELKRHKKYYDHGIKNSRCDTTTYTFISNHQDDYYKKLKDVQNTEYFNMIKNPSLMNLDQSHPNKIDIVNINNTWYYKKYIKYDDDWQLLYEGPCTLIL
jgi:hypothetical protein